MATTEEYMRSTKIGIRKLSELFDRFEVPVCEKCGHGPKLTHSEAHELDNMIWEALRFAEARR